MNKEITVKDQVVALVVLLLFGAITAGIIYLSATNPSPTNTSPMHDHMMYP